MDEEKIREAHRRMFGGRPKGVRTTANPKKLREFLEWYRSEDPTKLSKRNMILYLKITEGQAEQWIQEINKIEMTDGVDKLPKFVAHLESQVYKPGASKGIQELYARVSGWLEDKSKMEITHKVDGSFYTKVALAALRRDREESIGVDALPQQPGVLRKKLRLPSGQGKTGDSKV